MLTVQRTLSLRLQDDADLSNTLAVFQSVQNRLSPLCYNNGKPIGALQLQREQYHNVKGELNSQMTIMAMRLVSGTYVSAKKGYQRRLAQEAQRKTRSERKGGHYKPRPIKEPGLCEFKNPSAMFLVGSRGRDADFRKDGTLSIWTTAGRKRLAYTLPDAFRQTFAEAVEIDSLTVIERNGNLIGRVVVTLEVAQPHAVHPVGLDLNETNALVAVDADDNQLFVSGKAHKLRHKRCRQTRKRLQQKLASRKAQKQDTRSVRRLLKRQGRTNRNRTRTFCQTTAKQVCQWVKPDSVLVLEDLSLPQPQRGTVRGKALRRRLSLWQFGLMRRCIENKAPMLGLAVITVNPAYTSQMCNRCGGIGKRRRHKFVCPHCGYQEHADVNAAKNIRNKFVVLRHDGAESTAPEALSTVHVTDDEGKPPTLGGGS